MTIFRFQDFYGSHGPWAYKLVLSDFLNLVNLILNILFLQWYLRGQFIDYGIEFLAYQLAEIKVRGEAELSEIKNSELAQYRLWYLHQEGSPASIVNCTMTWSSIKWPNQNYEVTLGHVNFAK